MSTDKKMTIMVVGGGGREHAIIKKLAESPLVGKIYALPGNGGMAEAECVAIGAKDIDKICEFAVENNIEFAVVAPDDPLVLGAVDKLEEKGIKCFGPRANAAIIEGSKVFSKDLMKKFGIPTAEYEVFNSAEAALEYVKNSSKFPTVIKADGLALGKGVIIAETKEDAIDAVNSIMCDKVFGKSGDNIVIEEFLTGPEVSVLSFTDGKTMVPMISSMDHKRAGDNDTGLNTGGMGTVAPNPCYTADVAKECMEKIFIPTMNAMNSLGRTFCGCLYFGLMITKDGPKVIEYNCRFGDPETQVVLPLLETDLMEIMLAVSEKRLSDVNVKFSDKAACCVIKASSGYPQSYKSGFEITEDKEVIGDAEIYYAGAKKDGDKVLSAGGRVLGVTATAPSLEEAIAKAYKSADGVTFENEFYRKDIGQKALKILRG